MAKGDKPNDCGKKGARAVGITKPVVLILKKDGTPHLRVDYHLLNAFTRRDTSAALRMDECIESF